MRKLIGAVIVAAVLGFAAFWIVTIPARVEGAALIAHAPDLVNGRSMFYAGGCASCHAIPKHEDRTRLGGGLPIHSPFGTFYVPNISPHSEDGIGRWSEADFVTAMWKGTAPSGAHYFPAFPYTSYRAMALNDVRDLFAYIKTLAPVAGKAPAHAVPFPFNIRRSLGGWKFLFFDDAPFQPNPAQSAQWNRGAYLVNGPGHCAECHSPRNVLGGITAAQRLAGGRGLGAQHHRQGPRQMVAQGSRLFPGNRRDPGRRFRRRGDGARDRQHLPAHRAGPRGDGGLSQIAAAG
jgi:mono/diheme cytochrome c family protein